VDAGFLPPSPCIHAQPVELRIIKPMVFQPVEPAIFHAIVFKEFFQIVEMLVNIGNVGFG